MNDKKLILRGCILLLCLLNDFTSRSPFSAHAASSIEDELFGSSTEKPNETLSKPQASDTITDLMQKSSVGARADWSLFTSRQKSEPIGRFALSDSLNALIYLDSRPSDNLRGFIKTRLRQSLASQNSPPESTTGIAPQDSSSTELLELWMKWQTGSGLFWTIGKQPIKWGSATLWNPTDFLAAQIKDPLAFFDDRQGVHALRLQVPFEDENATLYFVASLPAGSIPQRESPEQTAQTEAQNAAYKLEHIQISGRIEWAYAAGEIAATFAFMNKGPTRLGLDVSTALGPLDLDLEGSCTARSNKRFYKITNTNSIEETTRKQQCLPQAVAGLSWEYSYGDNDFVSLGAEYFWNGLGHDEPLLELAAYLAGSGAPLYLADQYVGAWILLPSPASWNDSTFQANFIKNLADLSELYRLSYTHQVLIYSTISFGMTARQGVGEFRLSQENLSRASATRNPVPPFATSLLAASTPPWSADLTFSVTL